MTYTSGIYIIYNDINNNCYIGSAVKKGNQNHFGHKHSEETKRKISSSLKRNKELNLEMLSIS